MAYQKGFTLIELMVVIAIVAILSAAGIPSYQSYIHKAALTDMLQTFSHYRSEVELCALTQGGLESCSSGSPHISPSTTTRYISEMNVAGGTIALAGRETLHGLIVILTPNWHSPDGTLRWTRQCNATGNGKLQHACEEIFRFETGSTGIAS